MRISHAAVFACALMPAPALAQQGQLVPGEYITERGWGVLQIERGAKGALTFSIEAAGGNAHVCGLGGEIRNGKATLDALEPGKPCVVGFLSKGEGIQVTASDTLICHFFCGARASFPGYYLKVAPACTVAAVQKARGVFKQHYDRKDFAAARALLEPVLDQCGRTLDRLNGAWIRNDLAITQYRLGDLAACRQALQPLEKEARLSDEDVRTEYSPIDAENYLPVVRATRTNLKLCRAAGKKG